MAFRVTNNDTRPINIPPEYGGGILRPGSSATYSADSAEDLLTEAFGGANYGRNLEVLAIDEVPDTVTSRPGSYVPAVPGNWAGQAPRTLSEAINRLAAAYYSGFVGDGSTGIP